MTANLNSLESHICYNWNLFFSRTGRPIRFILERRDDMLITGGRHPLLGKYKVSGWPRPCTDATPGACVLQLQSFGALCSPVQVVGVHALVLPSLSITSVTCESLHIEEKEILIQRLGIWQR